MNTQFVNMDTSPSFSHLPINLTISPSTELLKQFVEALNRNGHLPYQVTLEKLVQVEYIQIAYGKDGTFIAGSTIKHYDGMIAEIGFMLVDKRFRRLGIAQYMTNARIDVARKIGASLIYAKVREQNFNSMNNLRKLGFRIMGHYLPIKDQHSPVTWLYLPLKPLSHHECCHLLQSKLKKMVSYIS